jgi:hypothetical protein
VLPRLIALFLIALLLMPNPLVHQRLLPLETSQRITATPMAIPSRVVGALVVAEAWHVDARNSQFGGISSMALIGDRRFLMASDNAMIVRMAMGRTGAVGPSSIRPLWLDTRASLRKSGRDLESMIRDDASGRIWLGFEHQHRIMRFTPDLASGDGEAAPAAMQGWNANGGAEALTLLPDGRMLVMAETSGGPGGGSDALLFARDPVGDGPATATPLRFAYDSEGKGQVTDAAALPNGRVLILHRTISAFDGWVSTLAVADSSDIAAGRRWTSRTIARFARPGLAENFEGLAVEPIGSGYSIWMVADDNFARWQRTLLLRLEWDGRSLAESESR